MSNITLAHGTKVQIGNGASTETFADIPQIFEGPSGPGITPEVVSFVHHSSDWEAKKIGTKKAGQVSFGILYDGEDTQHLALEAAALARTRKNFKEIFPDGTEFAFAAYVGMSFTGNEGDAQKASITLEVDGAVTITHS